MPAYMLFAQEPQPPAPDPAAKNQGPPNPLKDPMFLVMGAGLLLMLVILPARQRKQQQQLFSGIKRGAKVVTTSGIIGTIVTIKDNEDEMTIRSEDAKIKVLKSSVARVLGQDESEPAKA